VWKQVQVAIKKELGGTGAKREGAGMGPHVTPYENINIDVTTACTLEEGAHSPSWPKGRILLLV
jgi:hypothetical protein